MNGEWGIFSKENDSWGTFFISGEQKSRMERKERERGRNRGKRGRKRGKRGKKREKGKKEGKEEEEIGKDGKKYISRQKGITFEKNGT